MNTAKHTYFQMNLATFNLISLSSTNAYSASITPFSTIQAEFYRSIEMD